MRMIPLKTVAFMPISEGGDAQPVPYAMLIRTVLLHPGQPGQTGAAEIEQIWKILDAVDAATASGNDAVVLEEERYAFLNRRVQEFRFWARPDRALLEFITDVKGATEFDPNATKAA